MHDSFSNVIFFQKNKHFPDFWISTAHNSDEGERGQLWEHGHDELKAPAIPLDPLLFRMDVNRNPSPYTKHFEWIELRFEDGSGKPPKS